CASFLRQWPPERFGSLDQSHVAELRGVAAHVVEFVGKVPDAVAGRKRCERQSGQYTDRATLFVQEGTPRITGDPRCECVRAVVPAMTRAAEAEPLLRFEEIDSQAQGGVAVGDECVAGCGSRGAESGRGAAEWHGRGDIGYVRRIRL